MTNLPEELSDQFAAIAKNIAFDLCLVPEDETVKALKAIQAGFVESYNEIFPDSGQEGHCLAKEIVTAALIERHELERYGSVVSRAIH